MGGVCKNSTAVMAKMFDDPLWEKNIVNLSIICLSGGPAVQSSYIFSLSSFKYVVMLWRYLGILDSEKTHT